MNNNTIYALKGNKDWCDILSSLKEGVGRFGWSYIKNADLRILKDKIQTEGWESLSEEEKDCYQGFLLEIKENDYVVYINVPEWGQCTLAKVTGPYYWSFEEEDFNHRFPVDPNSIHTFERNDSIVHPALSSRLKLQRRWWRINLQDEFQILLESLEKGTIPSPRTPEDNLRFLSQEIQPFLLQITERIQHRHPNYDLERLISEVFKHVPGVKNVNWQGGAGDHGADIIVSFESGLTIPGLEQETKVVVQVKSFIGEHWDTQAVDDIRRAFQHYSDAQMGLIISTASSSTPALESALDKLKDESKKPVALLIGHDVAAFLLRFGTKLLA